MRWPSLGSTHCMDNFSVRVTGAYADTTDDDLSAVLSMVLHHHVAIVAWAEKDGALVLYWSNTEKKATPFLSPIDTVDSLHSTVVLWLRQHASKAEMDEGSDVSEAPNAFEAWTNTWGALDGDHFAALAIKPRTRWIGK